jgi:hypothetical protein
MQADNGMSDQDYDTPVVDPLSLSKAESIRSFLRTGVPAILVRKMHIIFQRQGLLIGAAVTFLERGFVSVVGGLRGFS